MKVVIAIAATALLVGCVANEPKPIVGPTGGAMYTIPCVMPVIGPYGPPSTQHCYEKAAELCPAGYDLLNMHTRISDGRSREILVVECR